MKHLLIIFTLLLTSVSWSKNIDSEDLVERDGLLYEKFTDKPFTGKSTGLKQGKIKEGNKEGAWLEYYENGQLRLRRNYKDRRILEKLTITSELCRLLRQNPTGEHQSWECNRYWTKISLHETGGPVPNYITLSGGGRVVEIGSFLSEPERKDLYLELIKVIKKFK